MPSMPSDAETLALETILTNIDLALGFAAGMTFETFEADVRTFYAVTRCLEIVSEASRRLSAPLKLRHPHIPWRDIAGSGNVYRHDYEDIAHRLVWGTVRSFLPTLRLAIEAELSAR